MIEVVFISDLHLHPDVPEITNRFYEFLDWAKENVRSIYILGDFFHAWAGDDTLTPWSQDIGTRLQELAHQGIRIYFLPGNRDFLLGKAFADVSGMHLLAEPTTIKLSDRLILLVHGDRYCTQDKMHQWFRRLTRNPLFIRVFLMIPKRLRARIVDSVRTRSQQNTMRPASQFAVDSTALVRHMQKQGVTTVIHGHTHVPGCWQHKVQGTLYQHYVLSDWDDTPALLCYDYAKGFYFNPRDR